MPCFDALFRFLLYFAFSLLSFSIFQSVADAITRFSRLLRFRRRHMLP